MSKTRFPKLIQNLNFIQIINLQRYYYTLEYRPLKPFTERCIAISVDHPPQSETKKNKKNRAHKHGPSQAMVWKKKKKGFLNLIIFALFKGPTKAISTKATFAKKIPLKKMGTQYPPSPPHPTPPHPTPRTKLLCAKHFMLISPRRLHPLPPAPF